MKKLILSAIIVLAGTFSVSAAAKAAPAKAAPEAAKAAPAQAASCEQLRPLDQWTFFQVAFLPYVPNAQMNSNVYGIKSGWPVTCGYGRVFGLEASWIYSGTNHIKGIQASWICNNNESCDGIQASFVVSINRRLMRGLQATMVYTHAGDLMGIQGGLVSLADDVYGVQGGLAYAQAKNVTGFQAAGVCVNTGKLTGIQCNLYGQVADSTGVQFGLINVSHGKGVQFGLINYIKDAWLPFFPIVNFAF